jgi:uncharacterized integral membrane protein
MTLQKKAKLAGASLAGVLFVAFAFLNRESIEVSLIIAKVTMPLSAMLVAVFLTGLGVGWVGQSLFRAPPKKLDD